MNRIQNKRTIWAARIVTTLVALVFLPGAIMKVLHHPTAVEGFIRGHIPREAILPIGIVELFCLAVYLLPRTAGLGTLLLTGYLGGATMANIISGSDFIHALVIGLLVWAGACLRLPEFRRLLLTRSTNNTSGATGRRPDGQDTIVTSVTAA